MGPKLASELPKFVVVVDQDRAFGRMGLVRDGTPREPPQRRVGSYHTQKWRVGYSILDQRWRHGIEVAWMPCKPAMTAG